MKTKIAIQTPTGYYVIKAEPVTVCDFQLAVHPALGHPRLWNVTEPRTGYALVSKAKTRKLALNEAVLRIQSHGKDKVRTFIDRVPSAPPVDTLEAYAPVEKKPVVDCETIVDLIARRVGGLTADEQKAVSRALNSRTGQLKARSPSAFGDADEQLAAAAWQGLQPNGYKIGIVSVISLRGPAAELYAKLSKVRWPSAFDKDRAALEKAGVW